MPDNDSSEYSAFLILSRNFTKIDDHAHYTANHLNFGIVCVSCVFQFCYLQFISVFGVALS